ncbi:MAG: hypothetical protein E7470_05905 [Ruminococcaceae bacterium]|nr:hypothetical protein [Oscillospiraceae bacterium]
MKMLYAIMAVISIIVRQFYLPNPFECFGDTAWLYNLIAEPIIHVVALALVGLIYRKGEFPALGSFLYLVAYAAITGILALMGIFSFGWWWVLIIVVAMVGVGVLLGKLWRWLSGETW